MTAAFTVPVDDPSDFLPRAAAYARASEAMRTIAATTADRQARSTIATIATELADTARTWAQRAEAAK